MSSMKINAITLALKSLRHKPLSTAMNMLLMAVGIAMMTFILSVSTQLADSATRDAEGIDLVVGAKGSPLQLILSSIYQVDTPTGNIPLSSEALLKQNRMVKNVTPLALGDSYQGFRIVGTSLGYIQHYQGVIDQGQLFAEPMQAVIGAQVAKRTGIKLGQDFYGSHGLTSGGEVHDGVLYKVVGILKPGGSVLDRLIVTPVASVWAVHEKTNGLDASDPEEKEAMEESRELTALLVQYASPLAAVTMPRFINSQSELQAAQPALEAAKLFRLMGVGIEVLRGIAIIVLLSAALSMFVALYNALEERKADLAILRMLGASPRKLFVLLLIEGCVLALAGALLGWLIGHVAVEIFGHILAADQNLSLSGLIILAEEFWLILVALGIGLIAALLPAIRAYRTDIANTLSH